MRRARLRISVGFALLAVWLIIWGAMQLFGLRFIYSTQILGILALGARILILVGA